MTQETNESKGNGKLGRSKRGPFEIAQVERLEPPGSPGSVSPEAVASYFEHSALSANHDEEEIRSDLYEMSEAIAPGTSTTPIFVQPVSGGFSVFHVWFGPNFDLFRHSHPRAGDCLYYVLAGEVILGKKHLGPGSSFFLPNGMPYKYKVGPEGTEVLEIRSGGGTKGTPVMKLDETSLDSIRRLTATAKANQHLWNDPPTRPGELLERRGKA